MVCERVRLLSFSPTGTTRRILTAIGEGIGLSVEPVVDLTLSDGVGSLPAFGEKTLAVIGTPVYAGRVPETALARLDGLHGEGAAAVLVVVYGNRAFEDALLELATVVATKGFVPMAAGAFIGEHSFSRPETPIAVGRPDATDLGRARAFGRDIGERLAAMAAGTTFSAPVIPGKVPYRARAPRAVIPPVSRNDICLLCGQCAAVCPVGAIRVGETVETDAAACIQCCACVRACPNAARMLEDPRVQAIAGRLATNCAARREPELFW